MVSAAGTVAIGAASGNLANNLTLRLDNVQVQDINELLLGNRSLAGVLNASAEIRGTRNDPVVESDFAVTEGTVEGVKFNALTGKAHYAGRAVDLDARLEQTPAAVLTAVGTVPVPNGPGPTARTDEFDLAVKSTPIDIALSQPATTQVTKLAGQFSADVRVRGTLEAPRCERSRRDDQRRLQRGRDGRDLHERHRAPAVRGRSAARGSFRAERRRQGPPRRDRRAGNRAAKHRSGEPADLDVEVQGARQRVRRHGDRQRLRVTGEVAAPTVTGEIATEPGRLEVDQILEQLVEEPLSHRSDSGDDDGSSDRPADAAGAGLEAGRQPAVGVYDTATIDVRLRLPDDLLLRGRDMHASFSRIGLGDMNITVGGELQIRKVPAGQPDVIGTVTVVRGYYDFQGRRFEVLRDSQIRFQGTRPVDPALQVDAQRIISGVTAIVNIRGTARQPQVRLSSQPPLDEADVLSLIVFNQPINQLGGGERLNLAERAGGLAVGYLATPLANSIARTLDLDMFEIRATGGETGQPSIAVGQQLGSRLFVSFRQEFGSDDFAQLSLEYRINELLRVVSTVTQGNQRSHRTQRIDRTGLDLIYTLSY